MKIKTVIISAIISAAIIVIILSAWSVSTMIVEENPSPEENKKANDAGFANATDWKKAQQLGLKTQKDLQDWRYHQIIHDTPEENAARQKAAAEAEKTRAEAAKTKALCHSEMVCREYGEALQQCAIAADIDACIDIKMGADASSPRHCTVDGHFIFDHPTFRECLFIRLRDALGWD